MCFTWTFFGIFFFFGFFFFYEHRDVSVVGRVGVSSTESKSGGGGSGGSGPSMLSSSSSNFGGFGSGLRVASSGGALFSDDLEEDKSSKEYEMIWSYVDYCFFLLLLLFSSF